MRDITERQRSLEFILWQYKNNVLPAMQQYVLPSKHYADLVVKATLSCQSWRKPSMTLSWTGDAFSPQGRYGRGS